MSNTTKVYFAAGVVIIALVVVLGIMQSEVGSLKVLVSGQTQTSSKLGTTLVGTAPIENYVPAIMYNKGYYSNYDITTNGILTTAYSYDGFVAGNTNMTIATGTDEFVYTNTTGIDMLCNGSDTSVFASSTLPFTPTIQFAFGTSTSATGYSTNLFASTTIASTSVPIVAMASKTVNFVLSAGSSIVGSLSDTYSGTAASSTYYGGIIVRPSFPCWLMGQ
jgi:hypothetical protein